MWRTLPVLALLLLSRAQTIPLDPTTEVLISLESDNEYQTWLSSTEVPTNVTNSTCVPSSSYDGLFTIMTPRDIYAPFFWECVPISPIVSFYYGLFVVAVVGFIGWVAHVLVYTVRVKAVPRIQLVPILAGVYGLKIVSLYYHWTVGWIDLTKRDERLELDESYQGYYNTSLFMFWAVNNLSYGVLFGLFTVLAKGLFVLRKEFDRREWTSVGIIVFGASICYSQMFYVGRFWTNGNFFLLIISFVTIRVLLALRDLNLMAILLYKRRMDGVKIVSKKIRGADSDQLVDEPASSIFNAKIRVIQWFTIASTVYLGTTIATEVLRRVLPLAAPLIIMELSSMSVLFSFGYLYRLERETVYSVGIGTSAHASSESLNGSELDLGMGPFITQLRTLVGRIRRQSNEEEGGGERSDSDIDDEPPFASRVNITLSVPSSKQAGKNRLMYAYRIQDQTVN